MTVQTMLRPQPAPATVPVKATMPARIWPALIVGYAALLPKELGVELAGASLFPWRLAAILVLPLVFRAIIKEPLRLSLVDFAAIFAGTWLIVSLVANDNLTDALVVGGSQMIDVFLIYIAGRSAIRSRDDVLTWFRGMLPGLLAVALILAMESLSGGVFFRAIVGDLVGSPVYDLYSKPRFGMARAMGPFSHPIMAGVVTASLISIAWYVPRQAKHRNLGLFVAFCGVFTLSSTTVLAAVISLAFIALFGIRRHLQIPSISLFLIYLALFCMIVSVVSESGLLSWAIRNLMLDAGSGYYRLYIWEYAGAEALNNPVFGIGLRDWQRPTWMFHPTIDSFWLVNTMRYGFPLTVAIFLMMAGAIYEAVRGTTNMAWAEADTGHGLAITLGVFAFCGISVHIWEGANGWMFLLVGLATSLGSQRVTPITSQAVAAPPNYPGLAGQAFKRL